MQFCLHGERHINRECCTIRKHAYKKCNLDGHVGSNDLVYLTTACWSDELEAAAKFVSISCLLLAHHVYLNRGCDFIGVEETVILDQEHVAQWCGTIGDVTATQMDIEEIVKCVYWMLACRTVLWVPSDQTHTHGVWVMRRNQIFLCTDWNLYLWQNLGFGNVENIWHST